ncbi:MAG: hypothetical protein ACI8TQ_000997 [Planctomycetota bacterium]|jgi:hypothetical protein
MTDAESPKPRWKKIVLIQCVLWPSLFGVVDVVLRLVRGYDSEAIRIEVSEIVESMNTGVPEPGRNGAIEDLQVGNLGLHPYTGFAQRYLVASHSREFFLNRDESDENEYRIMILGGSVAGGFGNKESAGLVQLRKALGADPRFLGRTIRIIPQGHGSFKQPQQLNLANYLMASGVLPHAVINLDGFNEVALALENANVGVQPTYPAFSQWVHLSSDWGTDTLTMVDALIAIREAEDAGTRFGSLALKWGLHHSSLLGPQLLKGLRKYKRDHTRASNNYIQLLMRNPGDGALAGPKFFEGEESVLNSAVRMWSQSSRALRALCDEHGVFYMHVLQPTLNDVGSKQKTPEEIRKGTAKDTWQRAAVAGYPLLREAGLRLMQRGVNYLDGSKAFVSVESDIYYDACHFNQRGNAILGRLIGNKFLASLPAGELPR